MAFNYRYMPVRGQLKELLMGGVIGDVMSVDFHWMLDTHHGADYFRRWHSQKRFSGGLMVHKATHHFDLVNWWLSAMPVSVRASGRRDFYTPAMAKRLGLASHHERCHTCPEKKKCSFELDLAKDPKLKSLYLDQEKHDGYFRDRCVFRPEIDIEDTMNVVVNYDTRRDPLLLAERVRRPGRATWSPSTAPRAASSTRWREAIFALRERQRPRRR